MHESLVVSWTSTTKCSAVLLVMYLQGGLLCQSISSWSVVKHSALLGWLPFPRLLSSFFFCLKCRMCNRKPFLGVDIIQVFCWILLDAWWVGLGGYWLIFLPIFSGFSNIQPTWHLYIPGATQVRALIHHGWKCIFQSALLHCSSSSMYLKLHCQLYIRGFPHAVAPMKACQVPRTHTTFAAAGAEVVQSPLTRIQRQKSPILHRLLVHSHRCFRTQNRNHLQQRAEICLFRTKLKKRGA